MASNLRTIYDGVAELIAHTAAFQTATESDSAAEAKKHVIVGQGLPHRVDKTYAHVMNGLASYHRMKPGRPDDGSVEYRLYIPFDETAVDMLTQDMAAIDIADGIADDISHLLDPRRAVTGLASLEWSSVEQIDPVVISRLTDNDELVCYTTRYRLGR